MGSDFNAWPWFWGALFLYVLLAVSKPPDAPAFTVAIALTGLTALMLLIIGIVNAYKRWRGPK